MRRPRIPARDGQNERAIAVGRGVWKFAGFDEGGRRAAAVFSMIESCKLNDVDPQAWLADFLARRPDRPANQIGELLPWRWKAARSDAKTPADAAAA